MAVLTREEIKANLISAEKTPYGYRPKGSPFIIAFSKELDPAKLARTFSCGLPPFYIFGIKSKVAKDEYVIYGTDLQNSCPIEIEVTSKWMVIHLRRFPNDNDGEDCVDTLLRLFENVKAHFDEGATLKAEGGGGMSYKCARCGKVEVPNEGELCPDCQVEAWKEEVELWEKEMEEIEKEIAEHKRRWIEEFLKERDDSG